MFRKTRMAVLCLFVAAPTLYAGTDDTTFDVTATVAETCTIEADNLDFGPYDPFAATALDGAGEVRVRCTSGTTYDIQLDDGDHASAGQRRMQNTTEPTVYLNYELYSDIARENRWGDEIGVDTVGDTGNGLQQAHAVYGRIPAEQNVEVGSYLDTITATVNW